MKAGIILFFLLMGFAITLTTSDSIIETPRTSDEIHGKATEVFGQQIVGYMKSKYLNDNAAHLTLQDLQSTLPYFPEYPRQIVDSSGKTVTISRPIERIVAYNYHAINLLDADDKVVAVAHSALADVDAIPSLKTKKDVGGGGPYEPDFESILATNPDMLLSYSLLGPGKDFFENRLPDRIPVVRLDIIRPQTIREDITKLGYLLDKEKEAQGYVAWYDSVVDPIKVKISQIPDDKRARVFLDVWNGNATLTERRTNSNKDPYHQYCVDAGTINIAADAVGPSGTIDTEWIMRENPDIILGLAYKGGYNTDNLSDLSDQYNEIMSIPLLQNTSAIKNNRVYVIGYRFTNGPTYPAAFARMAKWMYPELFPDLDPERIHQEYLSKFLRSSYNVSEHGVYYYPK